MVNNYQCFSDHLFPHYQTLIMGTEMVPERYENLIMGDITPETSVIFNQLTWLIAREDFLNVARHKIYRSYTVQRSYMNRRGEYYVRPDIRTQRSS